MTVDDVIQRLRASKARAEDKEYGEGKAAGREWAARHADAGDLERLRRYHQWCGTSWDQVFEDVANRAYSAAELVYFGMYPEHKGERAEADAFWNDVFPDATHYPDDPAFLKGFLEGALELWEEVRDRL